MEPWPGALSLHGCIIGHSGSMCLSVSHRALGNGGSRDVHPSVPGDCHPWTGRLEATLVGLWLVLLVSLSRGTCGPVLRIPSPQTVCLLGDQGSGSGGPLGLVPGRALPQPPFQRRGPGRVKMARRAHLLPLESFCPALSLLGTQTAA